MSGVSPEEITRILDMDAAKVAAHRGAIETCIDLAGLSSFATEARDELNALLAERDALKAGLVAILTGGQSIDPGAFWCSAEMMEHAEKVTGITYEQALP